MRYHPILWFSVLLPVAVLAQNITSTYDVREATIESVHNALFSGLTSCRGIVEAFIARIEAYNPFINAIITLNPNALAVADALDLALAAGNATGALFCIPILLKDNYDTADMKTTGGCLALADSQPTVDAPVVTALKRAGAIVLGKTNLHELALEGLSVSSLGGQTLNPYDLTRTPGGSSGGTGAAIAASFAVFGTGTDTVNSLRSPASANNLFSVRPTRGLISRSGIIPISYTQDAIGPIARNFNDLAIALNVMTSIGYDADDNTTALIPPSSIGIDYAQAIAGDNSLRGARLGLIEGFFNRTPSPETTPVNAAMDAMTLALTTAGATIIPIPSPLFNSTALLTQYDTQRFEYRQAMDTYLTAPALSGTHPPSLNALYASRNFLVIPSQYPYVTTALASSPSNTTYAPRKLAIADLSLALQATFTRHALDALIYPEQANLVAKVGAPSQSGRNGILAALTGSPVVTVAAGFGPASKEAPRGVPVGMEILGRAWSEGKLLGLARGVEGVRRVRRMPALTEKIVEIRSGEGVPVVVPDTKGIPKEYPIGVL
jgi:Asp-tRNA(Asn)/Glu-tRNA(Gln) amidotransferase A subunit family amidase